MEQDDGTWIVTDIAVMFLYTLRHIFESSCLLPDQSLSFFLNHQLAAPALPPMI